MSRNQLIALAAVALVLAIAFVAQRAGRHAPDLERELGLRALAPEEFLASDVSRVEVFRGSKRDEKVVIVRGEDGWAVESAHNAPGKKDEIDGFLKKLKDLEGEYRSDDPSVLGDYALTGEKALHVAAYRKGDEEAWYHILVGAKEAYGRSFVRREGEDDV